MKPQRNWYENPTKNDMLFVVIGGLTGFILLLLSMTNFFNESPFKTRYTFMYLLLLGSGMTIFHVCKNYFKKMVEQVFTESNC